MGLLPLLGAGHTHRDGHYRQKVAKALRFLIRRQKRDGSFLEPRGNMYSQGLATLALCEALGMTQHGHRPSRPVPGPSNVARDKLDRPGSERPVVDLDKPGRTASDEEVLDAVGAALAENDLGEMPRAARLGVPRDEQGGPASDDEMPDAVGASPAEIDLNELRRAAQRGLRFIEKAQHARGGWRYTPGQAGDTSVVGWQIMALKSGYLAGLDVKPQTVKKAVKFLDFVSEDRVGSCYAYTRGARRASVNRNASVTATTPIGLLCRMYTGWDRKERGLAIGVERLERWARPKQGMYFYFYATQVMHHYEGPSWQKWNVWMRDHLVKTQDRKGPETGSWSPPGGPYDEAGRLYCTSMATMTLEVYYRYSPSYGHEAVATTPVK